MTEAAPVDHPAIHRKKFATPPVKIACLACRASRTRCDGASPCASCQARGRECQYKPSRRGGARVRKKRRTSDNEPVSSDDFQIDFDAAIAGPQEVPQDPLALPEFIGPGAGLAQLQDWFQDSDFIYDSLFTTGLPGSSTENTTPELSYSVPIKPIPIVRTYASDNAILEAYYVYIHPFFPILPPPAGVPIDQPIPRLQNHVDEFDQGFEATSPLGLAISAILALIPCPEDIDHLNHDSVMFRRKYAQYLAQAAFESIEVESEIPESSTEPSKVLETYEEAPRPSFHPGVPREWESVIALDILSVYEYAQRGNIKKMQNRAGQALVAAMELSLHSADSDQGLSDVRSRVWWMTYICVCQGSIVGNTKPTFDVFMSSFTTKFPVLQCDPEAFRVFIQAQQAILTATQFVIELNKTVEANGDMSIIYNRMKELESLLEPLNTQSESWVMLSTTTSPVDPSEEVVARALRCMARIKLSSARIKLHRYCAFFDIPVFSGKHCDLKSITTSSTPDSMTQEPQQWPSCSCSSFTRLPASPPELTPGSTISMHSSPRSCDGMGGNAAPLTFPFSSHQSAKICLKAALAISSSFDLLPFPNPTGVPLSVGPCYLSPTSAIVTPRTMPSFACCAMQCAYALLMVDQKTRSMYPDKNTSALLLGSLLVKLQQGLASILGTLENYATAFEALGGMRDQIRNAVDTSPLSYETM